MLKVILVGTEVVGILKDVAEMEEEEFQEMLEAEFGAEEWEEIKSNFLGKVGEIVSEEMIEEYELEEVEISFKEYVEDIRLVYFAE